MALKQQSTSRKTELDSEIIDLQQVEYAYDEAGRSAAGQDFASTLLSYNPLTEWGTHYERILEMDYFPEVSTFDMLDMHVERCISGTKAVDHILQEDPDFRIIYCDSKLCDDLITRGSVAAIDVKKIIARYDMSIVFLDYFIGRNRPTIGSRKVHHPDNPSKILSYDIWYILPSRIYSDEKDYDCHFILFTLYVHYDCQTRKTFTFCIHRLGSEHQTSAKLCSGKIKLRMRDAIQRIWANPAHSRLQLKDNPFALQLPTITSSVCLWTEALHTERLSMWERDERGREDLSVIDTAALHNVSRYIHSYKTNILFTLRVLVFLRNEHAWFAKRLGDTLGYSFEVPAYEMVEDTLNGQIWQMEMISTYADTVVKRTQILIETYFNRIAETDSNATTTIAEETSNICLGVLQHVLFPNWRPLWGFQFMDYPAIVFPTTTFVITCWWAWHRRYQRTTPTALDTEGRWEK